MLAAASTDLAVTFIELGAVVLGLALLARISGRIGISTVPFYLLAGLAFGQGGLVKLNLSEDFVELGAQIGVILLLLALGLEYTAEELTETLKRSLPDGVFDLVANFTPGVVAGLLLGWDGTAAAMLGGVTYISSSGVVAKVLGDLDRVGNRETPVVLSLLVMEDLAMAAYLPAIAVLAAGQGLAAAGVSVTVAVAAVALILIVAVRYSDALTRVVFSESDETLLLTVLGATLVVAGTAEQVRVSAAVGAFLVGIALSGPVSLRISNLVSPLRDLFAAIFFLFFGLEIRPGDLPDTLTAATALAVLTAATKVLTGWWAARRAGIGPAGRLRAGTVLIARGEFSIVIAGLAVTAGLEPELGPLAAGYVLILAVLGPLVSKYADAMGRRPAPAAR